MALYNYKKYKISQSSDSKKTQGLKAGDIVRRQYFDAPNLIYTLMVVLNTGTEEIDGKERSFFIGALLEGDAPQQDQLLDFVRITSVYDPDRTGALYLTASDQEAPFMDVIDGLVSDNALTYPTSINKFSYVDPVSQYVVQNQE